ncbi:MAG: hypothetical protein IBJ17_12120 [Reyranella sp.]|nr:hypothetical protein [Reyranella sp.]
MTAPRPATLLILLIAALGLAACEKPKPQAAAVGPGPTPQEVEFNDRKESLLQQLATCESGSWGPQPRPIYGSRGAYHGRFQFTLRTFMTYTRMRDGTVITAKEAAEYAQDYYKAANLAWYMIYDLNEPWHWPLCSRKLGIPAQLRAIRAMAG